MKPRSRSLPCHCHSKDSKHVEAISPSSVSLFSSDFLFFHRNKPLNGSSYSTESTPPHPIPLVCVNPLIPSAAPPTTTTTFPTFIFFGFFFSAEISGMGSMRPAFGAKERGKEGGVHERKGGREDKCGGEREAGREECSCAKYLTLKPL